MARVSAVADAGLGNSSYVAEVGPGLALVVDPGRDPRPYLDLAAADGLRVAFAAETHLHADFVSGGRELAGLGARLLAPAGSGLCFGHEELRHEQELDLGGLTLRAVATPGHTPEHLSYLLLDGTKPVAVFTGATIVDARPVGALAAAHVPGSLSNALRPAFATWLGWLADPRRPLVAVLDDGQDRGELVEACLKVGYDNLAGELDGGITAWQAAGLATASIPLVDAGEAAALGGRMVLDVRQDSEWAAGHIPGAAHRELGALASPGRAAGLPEGPVTVMCEHGERAMTGASLLTASGTTGVSVLRGGPGEWAKATGEPLEHG
jgi:rhodanese-related sulfurtransferase